MLRWLSRNISWIEASMPNKNPAVIAKYCLDCIEEINGAPCIIRHYRGVGIQTGIRRFLHNLELPSFLFRKSTSNQLIETWLPFFQKRFLQVGMNLFKDKKNFGLYDNFKVFHVECLKFCLHVVIHNGLTDTKTGRNTNRIQRVPTAKYHQEYLMLTSLFKY